MSDFECLRCEHHKNRAARWRAEAYKQAGHDKIELPWVGLTDEERHSIREWQEIQKELGPVWAPMMLHLYEAIEAKLKEKNHG